MKKILFLGAPIFQIPIIEKAKNMGLYVGAVDINPDAPAKEYADESYEASITSFEEIIEIARKFRPNGIICGACDTSVVTCARVCMDLGLPGNTVESAINSTDKLKMLETFEKNNIPHPQFQFVKKEDVNNVSLEIQYPVISKPVDSAGGRGINLINSSDGLYEKLIDSSIAGNSGDILIEEYMEGPEVSVEVVILNGIATVLQVTDKVTSGAPYFFEVGHSQPSTLPKDTVLKIKQIASSACLAVGLINSVAHVEIKITKEGPKLVELGARMGGDCITTHLIDTSIKNVSMSETAIKISLGEECNLENLADSGEYSAVLFIPSKKGIVKEIVQEYYYNTESIIDFRVTAKIGKEYGMAKDDTGRFGYAVAKGKTKEAAFDNCRNAINSIKVIMDE